MSPELEFVLEDDDQAVPGGISQRKVICEPKDQSIYELHRQNKKGNLKLDPEFQRFRVWEDDKSSRLIESVLLDVPIPTIFLAEEQNSTYSVIDGQQRLGAFFDFLDNNLTLKKLNIMTELNGRKFRDLDETHQNKIENKAVHTIVVRKESQPDVRYEIFERLNTGAVQLNHQELRNCIFRGNHNKLLGDLAEDKDFLYVMGLDRPDKRMRDRELILRFFALHRNTHHNYSPPMKRFLNNEMREH